MWKIQPRIEDLQKLCANTLVSHLGIIFTKVGSDYLQAAMPMGPHLMQPLGTLHGGASCVLAETVANAAAYYCVDPTTHTCVGLDINTNHIRPIHSGIVTATARPYHIGKSTQVWSIEIRDEQEQLISISRLTVANILKKS